VEYGNRSRRTTARSTLSSDGASPRLARLLEDVTALFLSEGFLHLTTDDIAKRLRCSKSTLYQIASSREQIFDIVVARYLSRIRDDGLAGARQAKDAPRAMLALLGAGVTAGREASWEFVRDTRRHAASRRRLDQHQRSRVADLERLIEAGIRRGAFQGFHPRLVAELILVLIGRVFEPDLLASVGLSLGEAYDEAYRLVEYGLLPRTRERRTRIARGKRARRMTA
jgi:AcrR family transcriptional regulator